MSQPLDRWSQYSRAATLSRHSVAVENNGEKRRGETRSCRSLICCQIDRNPQKSLSLSLPGLLSALVVPVLFPSADISIDKRPVRHSVNLGLFRKSPCLGPSSKAPIWRCLNRVIISTHVTSVTETSNPLQPVPSLIEPRPCALAQRWLR